VEQVTALPMAEPKHVNALFGANGFAPPPPSHFDALRHELKIGRLSVHRSLVPPSIGGRSQTYRQSGSGPRKN
jgi:hypothetical protein